MILKISQEKLQIKTLLFFHNVPENVLQVVLLQYSKQKWIPSLLL